MISQQFNHIIGGATPIDHTGDNNQTTNQLAISSTNTTMQHSQAAYPPVNQTGPVKDHDRPYADYGHLNRQTIAEECRFNLQVPTTTMTMDKQSIRLNAKSFAITSWTNVSKDDVMNEIKRQFGIENIQYICIGEEISELNQRRHLHIQIIFKEKIDRRKPFLDEITKTHCNYQVTQNDRAWNEYIKKGDNCIEFNEFKSIKTRGGQKQWPSQSSSSLSTTFSQHITSNKSSSHSIVTVVNDPTTNTMSIRAQAEQRRQQKQTIAKQAINIAKTDVDAALKYMQDHLTWEFIHHFKWYHKYIYIHMNKLLYRIIHFLTYLLNFVFIHIVV